MNFVPDDSYLVEFFSDREKFGGAYDYPVEIYFQADAGLATETNFAQLSALEDVLEEALEYLQVCNLSNNKLENPGFSGGAPALITLNASNNALKSLAGGLQSSTTLTTLNISGNPTLTSVADIGELPALKTLDVSNCGLTSIDGLTNTPCLGLLETYDLHH